MRKSCCLLLALAMVVGASSQATASLVIAHWTYETSVPTTGGPHLAELGLQAGVATSTGVHAVGATVFSNPVGNGSLESFSSNNWSAGDYYQFRVNLTGYLNAQIQWDQTRSNTGPADFRLEWSTDGSTFSTINSYSVPAITWFSGAPDANSTFGPTALPVAVNNQSDVYVRLTSLVSAAAAGSNRVDNIIITAKPIPEPSALGLLGLSSVGMSLIRRRR